MPCDPTRAYASMGNYLFDPEVLEQALLDARRARRHRFRPRHPAAAVRRRAASTPTTSPRTASRACRTTRSRAYWRDVGTLAALAAAQQDAMGNRPRFNLWNRRWPIRGEFDAALLARIRGWTEERPRKPLAGQARSAGKPRVEISVATSGCRPAEVAPHPGALNLAPARRLAPRRDRAPHRRGQRRALGALEQETGLAVGDRVDQPAGGVRHRRRAVALAVHLVQPAGLEARRHQEEIGARLDQVGELLVEAGRHRDAAGMARGGAASAPSSSRSPLPEQRELRRQRGQLVGRGGDQVDALLVREAADEAEQRHRGSTSRFIRRCSASLLSRFLFQRRAS